MLLPKTPWKALEFLILNIESIVEVPFHSVFSTLSYYLINKYQWNLLGGEIERREKLLNPKSFRTLHRGVRGGVV